MDSPFHPNIDPELLVRFLSGDANDLEAAEVQRWIAGDDQNRKYFEHIKVLWESSSDAQVYQSLDLKSEWQKVRARINKKDQSKIPSGKSGSIVLQVLKIAAILLVAVGLYFIIPTFISKKMIMVNGRDTALVILPDGSKVYLNKNASLTYPEKPDSKSREVNLKGEAYFEITKDQSRPFLVNSGSGVVEVVGTSFNVKNIDSTGVIVSVVTGKVLVYEEANQINKLSLTPGEQGGFDKMHALSKASNQDVNFLSWKTGVLTFRNTGLKQVVSDLNRHYNEAIELGSANLESCTLTATFDHQTLEDVLMEMRLVIPVELQKNGSSVIINGEGCKPGSN